MFYITHISHNISTVYLENDKIVEFNTWQEARDKVIKLEVTNLSGLFGWKEDKGKTNES